MYIRFTTLKVSESSGRHEGLFQAIYRMRREEILSDRDDEVVYKLLCWLEDNLDVPTKFAKRFKYHSKGTAIGWFKDTAQEHISKMYKIKNLMEKYGIGIEVLKTERPGYIVYDDKYQITAIPFSDTKT